ncbi:MAG: hypothetical protein ACKPKO_65405, partial [Candidatus Fonsibacter sp.]
SNVSKGYADSLFKKEEARPYHEISQIMAGLKGNVCIDLRMGFNSVADNYYRIREVYETFYLQEQSNRIIYNKDENDSGFLEEIRNCDYFVVDYPDSALLRNKDFTINKMFIVVFDRNFQVISTIRKTIF